MAAKQKMPVTMLSGFLGAGKTTLLRHVLENSKEKIACIVNDVASINIDAKLVRNDRNKARTDNVNTTSDLADTIELANGCACCNLQDELFASFEKILSLADSRGEPYARIILENSGVAEPKNIRDKFAEAAADGHPLLDRVELDTLVTVVDSGTFIKDYSSRAPLAARPDLGDGGNLRPVVDLLVEQIETADFVVLNKIDMLEADKLEQLEAIVASLNPLAQVISCEQGKVPIERVFGKEAHATVAKLNIEGQHRGAVAAAKTLEAAEKAHGAEEKHAHDHNADDCAVCRSEQAANHSHHHHHHEHKHDHNAEDCAVCRSEHASGHHHHHHGHHKHEQQGQDHGQRGTQETRAAARFGIRSFVYSRRRPFHPQRLKDLVLKWLPVTHNRAIDGEAPAAGDSPIKTVLRSKGFMWMSNSHATAYFWSHAGQHFEIRDEGDWWAAVPREEWPEDPAQQKVIEEDFDASGPYGDRRQEIVFIGVGMQQEQICAQLDGALLSDEEMVKYQGRWCPQQ